MKKGGQIKRERGGRGEKKEKKNNIFERGDGSKK